jgi:hypothetical protein
MSSKLAWAVSRAREHWVRFMHPRFATLLKSTSGTDISENDLVVLFNLKPAPWVYAHSSHQQQLLSNFSLSISSSYQVGLCCMFCNHGRWLAYLPFLTNDNVLINDSVHACTLAHLGRLHHSQRLRHASRFNCGKALHMLTP